MTKSEMATELDDLRTEYERMELMQDIMVMVSRIVTNIDLQKIKSYVEKIYKKEMDRDFGFWYGVRDNIIDMANKLAELQNIEELQFFNTLMYGTLIDKDIRATDGLYTMTNGMKDMLVEHLNI